MVLNIPEKYLFSIFNFLNDGIIICDSEGKMVFVNQRASLLLNIKEDEKTNGMYFCHETLRCVDNSGVELCDANCAILQAGGTKEPFENFYIAGTGSCEAGGHFFPAACIPLMDRDGKSYSVLVFHDTSSKKELEEKLLILSKIDHFTGLYNRWYFNELYKQEVKMCEKHGGVMSAAVLCIANLKEMNREYGNEAGDEVIKRVSETLLATFRKVDVSCRYTGSKFAVVFIETTYEGAKRSMERCIEKFTNTTGKIPSEKIELKISIKTCTENFRSLLDMTEEELN